MKTAAEIRQAFLDYFKSKGHTPVESSALLPQNDPTLLFTNAGMVQFKDVFLGAETRPYTRATSSQKCMRAGGKHNDLENVGRTARHHTFFEMLGNFSFGDYFKNDAIAFAWEFITGLAKIPAERLYVTVFRDDDEAYAIWKKDVGVAEDRILRMGEKDNFWSMGDTGPCGPCSEILIDQGPEFSCGPDCKPGCDCDRYLELWNLVFMQFNRDAAGVMTPLPKPSIDTGMGLERITAVLQGKKTNYDTDLFIPIIAYVEKTSGKTYLKNHDNDVSMRIIADHSRAVAFLVADGVMPSNEGRGYVLRRIMRRAARHGKLLDITKPFLFESVRVVAEQLQAVYPEVLRSIDYIAKVVLSEEQTFTATLESGLKILQEEMEKLKIRGGVELRGDTVFKLYDTYGFPVDLTADIAREQGLMVDQEGFEAAMAEQRTRARQAWKGSGEESIAAIYKKLAQDGTRVEFTGYDTCTGSSRITHIIKNGELASTAAAGDEVEIITTATPFYGESGGQAGDAGTISGRDFQVSIAETAKPLPELIVHKGTVMKGQIAPGDEAQLAVEAQLRAATANNHTATHILQAVLQKHLGKHVKQAGSFVTPERLRFDFTHFEALPKDELKKIEQEVNRLIRDNSRVEVEQLAQKEAISRGAMALFGEKYGDRVRVVSVGGFSMELCGGTHIDATGRIGLFKIVSEGAVAAGVRRIEAVTGEAACLYVQQQQAVLDRAADLLKTDAAQVADRVEKLFAAQKSLEKEIEKLKSRIMAKEASSIFDAVRDIGGVKVLVARVSGQDPKTLRSYGDKVRDKLGSGVLVLAAEAEGTAQLLAMATKDIAGKVSAKKIIEFAAPIIGGRGGGRDDMAQAGGPGVDRLDEALVKAVEVIEKNLGG
ncbi:MAG: alanine--tRNA ligase [Deltaproteobacteria bacterium]|nr:alanine--tRNA ligase [Deltaproteobacteria bacterium]